MATITRRERIVQELERRIRVAYPKAVVERGWFKPPDVYPSIYILEDVGIKERDPKKRRGLYIVSFTVSISQWYAGVPLKDAYSKGNALLAQLTEVVECDELFNEDGDRSRPLTVDVGGAPGYECVEEIVRMFLDNKMEVYAEYKFTYTEEAPWVQTVTGR